MKPPASNQPRPGLLAAGIARRRLSELVDVYADASSAYEEAAQYMRTAERLYDPGDPGGVDHIINLAHRQARTGAALAADAQQDHDLFNDAQTVAAARTRPGKTGISL